MTPRCPVLVFSFLAISELTPKCPVGLEWGFAEAKLHVADPSAQHAHTGICASTHMHGTCTHTHVRLGVVEWGFAEAKLHVADPSAHAKKHTRMIAHTHMHTHVNES